MRGISPDHPSFVPPGIYTCSFYAKGTRAGQRVNVWIPHFSTGSMYAGLAHLTVSPGKDWRRYHFTFETKVSMPVNLNINADSPDGTGYVWLDGLQLESGSQATPFETKPVEGRLLTSAPDNFISAKEKINAKMKLVTIPGAKGKAVVKVKNFYNEEIRGRNLPLPQITPAAQSFPCLLMENSAKAFSSSVRIMNSPTAGKVLISTV